jgi:hypothetical protein
MRRPKGTGHAGSPFQGDHVTSRAIEAAAEPKAKAALLEFLRSTGDLTSRSAVSAELALENYRVRADLAVCNRHDLHCYEVKTKNDTLVRLDRQLEVYSRHADFVTVVAATKHINAIISRVEPNIGIIEMVDFEQSNPLRVVRKASRSPVFNVDALLSLVPVKELKYRLALPSRLRRKELVEWAAELDFLTKKRAIMEFFIERYGPNSRSLWKAARRRKICPSDLSILRRWTKMDCDVHESGPLSISPSILRDCSDMAVYRDIGRSFGPMPDEIKILLAS